MRHRHEFGNTTCTSDEKLKGLCLTKVRWNEIFQWCSTIGCRVQITLNAMKGRQSRTSHWDGTNARELLQYTKDNNLPLYGVGFGNELSNGEPASLVEPHVYGTDLSVVRSILDQIWDVERESDELEDVKPFLAAPDAGYATNLNMTAVSNWWTAFLSVGGETIDILSYHLYIDAGNSPSLTGDIMSIPYLEQYESFFMTFLQPLLKKYAPRTLQNGVWCDETAAAWGSGMQGVTNTFIDSFWYNSQLGSLAVTNHSIMARQALRGGYYEFINCTSGEPHPDFYSAVLWKRLMGTQVYNASVDMNDVLVFAHKSLTIDHSITLLILNFNTHSVDLSVKSEWIYSAAARDEYHLTANNLTSQQLMLNSEPILYSKSGGLPPLNPQIVPASSVITLSPLSIAFIQI